MTVEVDNLVYDTKDPQRYVGLVQDIHENKKAWVRWHESYATWVPLKRLVIAPEGKKMGDKLGLV